MSQQMHCESYICNQSVLSEKHALLVRYKLSRILIYKHCSQIHTHEEKL